MTAITAAVPLEPTRSHTTSDLISEELEEDLTCPVCYDVLQKPMKTTCGHSFCGRCIERWLKSKSSCPTCRTQTDANSLVFDRERHDRIAELPVQCSSCGWAGVYRELPTHLMDDCPNMASKLLILRSGAFFENVLREALRRFRQKKYSKIHCHTCRGPLHPSDYMFIHQTRCKKHQSHLKMHLECLTCAQGLFLECLHVNLEDLSEDSVPAPLAAANIVKNPKTQVFVALDEAHSGLSTPHETDDARTFVLSRVRQKVGFHCYGCFQSLGTEVDTYVCTHASHEGKHPVFCHKCFVSAKHCTFHKMSIVSSDIKVQYGTGHVRGPVFDQVNAAVKHERRRWFKSHGPLLTCNACGHCVDEEDFYRCLDCMQADKICYNLCASCYSGYNAHTEHQFAKVIDSATRPPAIVQRMVALSLRFHTHNNNHHHHHPQQQQQHQQQANGANAPHATAGNGSSAARSLRELTSRVSLMLFPSNMTQTNAGHDNHNQPLTSAQGSVGHGETETVASLVQETDVAPTPLLPLMSSSSVVGCEVPIIGRVRTSTSSHVLLSQDEEEGDITEGDE